MISPIALQVSTLWFSGAGFGVFPSFPLHHPSCVSSWCSSVLGHPHLSSPPAENPCRTVAGTWVYSQCSVPLLAIINSSRQLLGLVLRQGRVSLTFKAALSKYYPSQLRSKNASIPGTEHPSTNLALKMTLKLHTFLILHNNTHSEMYVLVNRCDKSAITGDTARSCTPGHYIIFTLLTPGWLGLTCMNQ